MPIVNYYAHDGPAEAMTGPEMDREYPRFPYEVHALVERMLGSPDDSIETVNDWFDSAALAVQALRLNVGGTLPLYGAPILHEAGDDANQTRLISPEDMFEITTVPKIIGARNFFRFAVTLERVSASEPRSSTQPTRLLGRFFQRAISLSAPSAQK